MATKKEIFYEKLGDLMKSSTDRGYFISNERYETLINETEEAQTLRKNKQSISSKQYRRLSRYNILKIGDTKKLIENRNGDLDDSNIRYYCKADDIFDVMEITQCNELRKKKRNVVFYFV